MSNKYQLRDPDPEKGPIIGVSKADYDALLAARDADAARIEALEAAKVKAHRTGYTQGKAAGDAFGQGLKDYVERLEAEVERLRGIVDAMNCTTALAHALEDDTLYSTVVQSLQAQNTALASLRDTGNGEGE